MVNIFVVNIFVVKIFGDNIFVVNIFVIYIFVDYIFVIRTPPKTNDNFVNSKIEDSSAVVVFKEKIKLI